MLGHTEQVIAPGAEERFSGQAGTMRLESLVDGRPIANWWYARDVAQVAAMMRREHPDMQISVIIDAPAYA